VLLTNFRLRCIRQRLTSLKSVEPPTYSIAKVGCGREFAELFACDRLDKVPHFNCASVGGRKKRRGQRRIFDITARHRELSSEEVKIQVFGKRSLWWKHAAPERFTVMFLRKWKLDGVIHPPCESFVYVKDQVGS